MSVSVDRLGPEDWQRNRRIRLRALTEDPDAFGSLLADARKLTEQGSRDRLARTDMTTLVATTKEGLDVGLIVGAPYGEAAGLFSMWVAADARKCGIGGALVDAVIAWARAAGHPRLFLDVGDDNLAAIALYTSRGFEPTGQTARLDPPRDHITEHQRVLILSS